MDDLMKASDVRSLMGLVPKAIPSTTATSKAKAKAKANGAQVALLVDTQTYI